MNNTMNKLDDLYNTRTGTKNALTTKNVLTVLQSVPFGPLMVKIYTFFSTDTGLYLYLGVLCTVVLLAYLLINHKNYHKYKPFFITGYCLLFFKIVFYVFTCGVMSSIIGDVSPAGSLPIYYNILYLYGTGVLFVELLMLGFLQDLLLFERKKETRRLTVLFKWFVLIFCIVTNWQFYDIFSSFSDKVSDEGMVVIIIMLAMQIFLLCVLPFIIYLLFMVVEFLKKVGDFVENVIDYVIRKIVAVTSLLFTSKLGSKQEQNTGSSSRKIERRLTSYVL
ncbi:uncharacterized protein VICG_00803 [Vittaforma corneae ATCC 50505]|uniref:Uncharacterized protein n=1 Tax=Vittaforma corneae (strain ATCC 50505) TaxID=993615 RepID=L2GNU8_VITCO|nr:uncharacterized protein VICG_00803 [Vittaforma corneae ATCC 50505]ELA42160.1 hypothetical protein VICG_00803 [Vittaforma corneae ATCC 50505]